MQAKKDGNVLLLLFPEIHSIKKPSEDLNQDHLFSLSYSKVDSKADNIINQKPTVRRYNNNDETLANIGANSQNPRILIVDDEQDVARLFGISLERNDFVVDVFNDPMSALSNYKADTYDLLLLDIRMPHMNGFELYQKIKDIDNKVKVCFITAYEESLSEFKGSFSSLEEVDCLIRKPIEIQKLVEIVKSKLN
jgi:two-component system, OmpR family, response regulator ChvI